MQAMETDYKINTNPCVHETPKQVLLQTVKTQLKCSISSGPTLFVKVKKTFRQKNIFSKS